MLFMYDYILLYHVCQNNFVYCCFIDFIPYLHACIRLWMWMFEYLALRKVKPKQIQITSKEWWLQLKVEKSVNDNVLLLQ